MRKSAPCMLPYKSYASSYVPRPSRGIAVSRQFRNYLQIFCVYTIRIYDTIMAKVLSLKMAEDVFKDAEEVVKELGIPRNTYINRAVAFYTRVQKRKSLAKQMRRASELVAANSMEVLREFEAFEEDIRE